MFEAPEPSTSDIGGNGKLLKQAAHGRVRALHLLCMCGRKQGIVFGGLWCLDWLHLGKHMTNRTQQKQ